MNARLPRLLLAIFVIGMFGVAAELMLIGHHRDRWQLTPFVVVAIVLAATSWHALRPGRIGRVVFSAAIGSMAVVGIAGMVVHFLDNRGFEMLSVADGGSWQVAANSLSGTTPVLAPASLVLLAAIGYARILAVSPACYPQSADHVGRSPRCSSRP